MTQCLRQQGWIPFHGPAPAPVGPDTPVDIIAILEPGDRLVTFLQVRFGRLKEGQILQSVEGVWVVILDACTDTWGPSIKAYRLPRSAEEEKRERYAQLFDYIRQGGQIEAPEEPRRVFQPEEAGK